MRLQGTQRAPAALTPLAAVGYQRRVGALLDHHFHCMRLLREPRPGQGGVAQRPLVVYLNRASSWDPLVCLQLAAQLMPQRRHFAPIESEEMRRFPLFGRLGFHPVDTRNAWGVRRLLAMAAAAFRHPDAVLWVAPPRAADPRQRPPRLAAGLGHLANRLQHGVLVPLAIEYPFWDDRRPEALLRFGEELAVEDAGMPARDWNEVLSAHLEEAQDALAAAAVERDPTRFEPLGGASGAGRVQEAWRRLRRVAARRRWRESL
jgi:hypothetical protein